MNFKKNDDFSYSTILGLSILSLLISIVMLSGAKSFYFNTSVPINGFYSKVINYTVPVMKSDSIDIDEYEKLSFIESLSKVMGLNNEIYLSIVGKEISYINADEKYASNHKNKNGIVERDSEHALDIFTLNDDQIIIEENEVGGSVDMNSAPGFSIDLIKEASIKPEVLIYHTHTCESYVPFINKYYSNIDKDKNMAAVGEELKIELEKYGITTIHDTTIHDVESYDNSYARSRVTLQKYLNEYKDFKLIIDLHRDSVEDKDAMTTKINGENVARFSFVMTKNHPNSEKNIKVAETLKEISNKLYPGNEEQGINSFYKRTFTYNQGKQFYSQDLNGNSVLVEMGSHVNTLDEAKASTKYLARIIAEYINGNN